MCVCVCLRTGSKLFRIDSFTQYNTFSTVVQRGGGAPESHEALGDAQKLHQRGEKIAHVCVFLLSDESLSLFAHTTHTYFLYTVTLHSHCNRACCLVFSILSCGAMNMRAFLPSPRARGEASM